MREILWPLFRSSGPQVQGLHYGYVKGGLIVHNESVPWNADAVLVNVLLRFPNGTARRKTDFALRQPGQPPLLPATLQRHEDANLFCLEFRLPVLEKSVTVEPMWKSLSLGQVTLPFVSESDFIGQLRIEAPTVHASIGETSVACRTLVAKQCKGLVASALLTSPTSLAPLQDLSLSVALHALDSLDESAVPVRLSTAQLVGRQALVAVAAPRRPKRLGAWAVRWSVDGQELARADLHVIGQRAFRKSLFLVDSRFAVQDKRGETTLVRGLPTPAPDCRIGPCFFLASREPGMAGLCPIEMRVHFRTPAAEQLLERQEILLTDSPCVFFPGTFGSAELEDVSGFEVFAFGQSLGLLSTSPAPSAQFTSEGGYRPPQEYTWTGAAEEELSDRLMRLMDAAGE